MIQGALAHPCAGGTSGTPLSTPALQPLLLPRDAGMGQGLMVQLASDPEFMLQTIQICSSILQTTPKCNLGYRWDEHCLLQGLMLSPGAINSKIPCESPGP